MELTKGPENVRSNFSVDNFLEQTAEKLEFLDQSVPNKMPVLIQSGFGGDLFWIDTGDKDISTAAISTQTRIRFKALMYEMVNNIFEDHYAQFGEAFLDEATVVSSEKLSPEDLKGVIVHKVASLSEALHLLAQMSLWPDGPYKTVQRERVLNYLLHNNCVVVDAVGMYRLTETALNEVQPINRPRVKRNTEAGLNL